MPYNKEPRRRICGTSEVHARLCEEHPEFRFKRGQIHAETAALIRSGDVFRRARFGPITIPVVVHVVFRTPEENISDAQIHSQIEALNRDFRARNTDKANTPSCWSGLIADIGIEFELAKVDPRGNSTSGITRTSTAELKFSTNDAVKSFATGGADGWPSDRYLNLWVCTLANSLLGFAQFPGGPADTDGVVILNSAFGTEGSVLPPFNLGRTAVHEVGHWLNLNHIWGDTNDCSGTDHVDDTPNCQYPNYGKLIFPHPSCNNAPNGDMFINYMDYVDDDTMVMFTMGQSARMHATLIGPRRLLGS